MEIQFSNLVAFLLFLSSIFLVFKKWKTRKLNLPPGPWKLPFIGSLHHLAVAGPLPHHGIKNLAKRYGPLMHLQLGQIPTLVISSPQMAKEVLKTHDLAFATRPKLVVADIIHYDSTDIAFSPYGEYWRQIRKICILELLSAKMVKFFSSIRQDELSKMVSSIRTTPNLPVNLTDKIFWFTSSVICRSALGKICGNQDKLIIFMREIISLAGGFSIADFFPTWKMIHDIDGSKSKLVKAHRKIDEILESVVNEHKQNRADGKKVNGEFGGEDLIDVLLRVRESGEVQIPITDDNIKSILIDMFSAGSETSSTTIIWALAEMMKKPSVLAKAQAEVRQALKGKKISFQEINIDELKYLKLVIKETLRMHPPIPLLVPRECMEDTKIDGYNIPFKTRVIVNAWAIGRDPQSWDDPESFTPERFENNSIDFLGNHHQFIPFGAGRRICPGMLFGLANVGQPLAQLLYHFDWKLPNGQTHQNFDMTESPGISATRKDDLILIATPAHS
ncbi:premnaspirodiene oxygenase-like [Nicotiana tabacum]|uniref:Premnaspirodiene oxygenase-like n=1 Tax=Nicotiana tabacum TaxID=4097 RepID=A0AC58SZF3_TOBAC